MPLYDKGSLGSAVEDLGIGMIILLPHSEGILPYLKHILNNVCKADINDVFLNNSTGIQSIPGDLPLLLFAIALTTSSYKISLSKNHQK